MASHEITPDLVRRYLAALAVPERGPSLGALRELVTAHLTRIPFENISKLYNRKHHGLTSIPPLELYLEGIERHHFGGTCYSNNFHFYSLLAALGYEVRLCGADMRQIDVHLVIIVTLEGHEYLVDAGYAAPFLAPLPRDQEEDCVVTLGPDRYVLRPQDARGGSRLEMYRDGLVKHGYLVNPRPRRIEEFAEVIAASFRPDATFLNALLLARFSPGRAVVIHNLTLAKSQENDTVVRQCSCRAELADTIVEYFEMPYSIVAEALSELGDLQDPWT